MKSNQPIMRKRFLLNKNFENAKLTFTKEKMQKMNWSMHNFKMEERRIEVTSLLAQSMTEIA
jgi:hypothetical protein